MRERMLYALLAMVFALSRLGYYLAGVRFDARPVLHYYQFIDPELLKHRLLESLFYLHIQPPGWNLYIGVFLKLFPISYPAAFCLIYLVLGLGIGWSTYYLMRVCKVSRWLAFALTSWFLVSPGVVLYENYLLYEYLVAFLLLMAAVAVVRFCRFTSSLAAAGLFLSLFALVLVRNFFHLVYFLAILCGLLWLFPIRRRTLVICAALPITLILALYAKNWALFGSFTGSTWAGMNMDTITIHQLTSEETRQFVHNGVISPAAVPDLGSPIKSYEPFVQAPARTAIPVLDDCITSTGAMNFNCLAFLQVQRIYTRDGFALLRAYPVVFWRSLATAWFTYFLPPGDFPFFDLNRPKIHQFDRAWNIVFFGQFKEASDRKELRRLAAQGARFALLLYTGTFLMIGLPAIWSWAVIYLIIGIRRKTLDRAVAILIGFLLLNIAYVTVIANVLSSFENNRYRFPLDAFYVVLLGLMLTKAQPRPVADWWRRHFRSNPAGRSRNTVFDSANWES